MSPDPTAIERRRAVLNPHDVRRWYVDINREREPHNNGKVVAVFDYLCEPDART